MKKALVCGAGGFIGGHLVKKLKKEGYWVRGVDLKEHEFALTEADDFVVGDLRDPVVCDNVVDNNMDEIYQLAADMGGAGFIFTGEHDAEIMHNSALCNLNILHQSVIKKTKKVFYSSSACIYPEQIQIIIDCPSLKEEMAYPANPDSEYGWEKLFSERLYLAYSKNFGIEVHIARFHNVFGPEGTWDGGREKAPAAICRKIAEAADNGSIEIWGDGKQTRSFLFIDECLEGVRRLMNSDFPGPVNIGSDERISINDLAFMVADLAGKKVKLNHIKGPLGVRGRSSNNDLIKKRLGWAPSKTLREGMEITYRWILEQVNTRI